jgi:AcrR family transcriptional regulator
MSAQSASRESGEENLSTADRLLAGAAELFRRKGYAATTTRQLSALLGIQNASLYYHMEKKEDLLYTLCQTTLQDVSRVLERCLTESSDPLQQLKLIIHNYTTSALHDRDRHATMLVEIRALSEERRRKIVELRDGNVAIVRGVVAAAQKNGQVRRDLDVKYLTLAMFNLLNWSIFWYRPDGELSPDQIADLLCSVFLDGAGSGQPANNKPRPGRSKQAAKPTPNRRRPPA